MRSLQQRTGRQNQVIPVASLMMLTPLTLLFDVELDDESTITLNVVS
jgi:hypothetical protein